MATTALGQLREQVGGETMTAEDPGHEARRIYNAIIDGRLIVRCTGAEDVVAAVNSPCIRAKSITAASSAVPKPGTLCEPPRTARSSWLSPGRRPR
jgi:hypothetical protein